MLHLTLFRMLDKSYNSDGAVNYQVTITVWQADHVMLYLIFNSLYLDYCAYSMDGGINLKQVTLSQLKCILT